MSIKKDFPEYEHEETMKKFREHSNKHDKEMNERLKGSKYIPEAEDIEV